MKLPLWIIAACVVVLGFAAWLGCAGKPPTPTAQNMDRYTIRLVAADGKTVLAQAKFGERARGGRIVVTDDLSPMNRYLGTDILLGYLNGEAR